MNAPPNELLPEQQDREILKDEPRARIERIGTGQAAVVRKTYFNLGLRRLQTFLRRPRAAREFRNLQLVQAAGVPCTEPIAWQARWRLGFVLQSTLVTRYLPGTRQLKSVLQELPRRDRARALLVTRIGELLAALHRAGILWAAPMPRNLLLRGDPARADLLLCDLPAAVHFRRTIHGAAIALLDLFDAAGSPSRRRDFSAAERLRLLTAYGGGDRTAARRLYRALDRRTRIGHRLRKNFVMALRTYILPAAVPDRPGREPPRR